MKVALAGLLSLVSLSAQTLETEFKIKYRLVHAGHAQLRYDLRGDTVKAFMTVSSSPWLNTLWTLSDSIQSTFLIGGPLLTHTKAVHEGSYHRTYRVVFPNPDTALVNIRVEPLPAEVVDVPQLVYQLRNADLEIGDTLRTWIWDGKSSGQLTLVVERPGIRLNLNPLSRHLPVLDLKPLQTTRKSRKHGIRLRLEVLASKPHEPIRITVQTRYGDLEMIRTP